MLSNRVKRMFHYHDLSTSPRLFTHLLIIASLLMLTGCQPTTQPGDSDTQQAPQPTTPANTQPSSDTPPTAQAQAGADQPTPAAQPVADPLPGQKGQIAVKVKNDDGTESTFMMPVVETAIVENELPSFADPTRLTQVDTPIPLGPATEEETDAVKSLFADLRARVLRYDRSATDLLGQPSFDYYQNMIEAAKFAVGAPAQYEKFVYNLPIGVRANIEMMKKRLSREFIFTTTPQGLYQLAFEQGWIGYKPFQTASLDNVQAYQKGKTRYLAADFYYEGTIKDKSITRIGFVKENDVWRVDLTPVFVAIDQAIEKRVKEANLDIEGSLDLSIEITENATSPEQWPVYTDAKLKFSAKFPKPPVTRDLTTMQIVSVMDHRYGQFIVRIINLDADSSYNPAKDENAARSFLTTMHKQLGASAPDCRKANNVKDKTVYCKFDVPEQKSTVLCATVFQSERILQIMNQAPSNRFDLDVAQNFVNSLSY